MGDCVNCKKPIPLESVEVDAKLSFKYENLSDVLVNFDERLLAIEKLLKKQIDKRWIKDNKDYTQDYIQDLVNAVDVLQKSNDSKSNALNSKVAFNSPVIKNLSTPLQAIEILLNEVSYLRSRLNNFDSNLYRQNV